jgi:hypothetical protein
MTTTTADAAAEAAHGTGAAGGHGRQQHGLVQHLPSQSTQLSAPHAG